MPSRSSRFASKMSSLPWSDEIIEGDFLLSAQVTSEHPDGQAQFVVYGDGTGFSDGCLIFTYGPGFALITRDTIYHEGENWLIVSEGDYGFRESTHDFTIEITGDVANFYVDGEKVAFTFFPVETKHQGRVGIFQHWEEPLGMTYSNLKIKALSKGDGKNRAGRRCNVFSLA
jgi:hypothetical protein